MIWHRLKQIWASVTGQSSKQNSEPQKSDPEATSSSPQPQTRSPSTLGRSEAVTDPASTLSPPLSQPSSPAPLISSESEPLRSVSSSLGEKSARKPSSPIAPLQSQSRSVSRSDYSRPISLDSQVSSTQPLSKTDSRSLRSPQIVFRPPQSPSGIEFTPVFSPRVLRPPQLSPRLDQVIWQDCDDVYRPIEKSIQEFTQEQNLPNQFASAYLAQEAYEDLLAHLSQNLQREQGGILFGNAYHDQGQGIYVKIVKAVPAPSTLGSPAHLEFTQATWQGIMSYAQEIYPHENIVGWYHSHPNIGVFMSYTDMNTQQAFFYHPWCLSIIYDPVQEEIGYFLGKEATPIRPVFFHSGVSF